VGVAVLRTWTDRPRNVAGQGRDGTSYVGRATLYTDEHGPLVHFTAVAWYSPESKIAVRLSTGRIVAEPGAEVPESPRVVLFEFGHADGVEFPILTKMPFGHLADPDDDVVADSPS
jgi:hypothetical protein